MSHTEDKPPFPQVKGKKGRPKGYVVSEETKAKMRATREANRRLKAGLEEIFHVSQTQL